MKIIELIDRFERDCPLDLQEDWDNSGIQIDFSQENLKSMVIGMDLSKDLLDFAIEKKSNFIFLHHPFFFDEIKSLEFYTARGKILKDIIDHRITVYSAHTNFDKVDFGVSDVLADLLELKDTDILIKDESNTGLGKVGYVEEVTVTDMAEKIKDIMNVSNVISYGDLDKKIKKVAVMGGSGAFAIDDAINAKADLLITGDIKYHDGQKANEKGIVVFDIGHYHSEVPSIDYLFKYFCNHIDEEVFTFKFDISKRKFL